MIKYIGSKRALLTHILSAIGAAAPAGRWSPTCSPAPPGSAMR
ncbi:hypothetical protein ACFQU2_24870 [Siccirubricoccus deserti]